VALSKKSAKQKLSALTLAASLVASGLTLWGAKALELSDNSAGFAGSAVAAVVTAMIPLGVGSEIFRKRRGTKALLADAVKGQIVRPIGLVVVSIGGILLLLDTLIGFLEGIVVGSLASTDEQVKSGFLFISIVAIPVFLICAFFVVERGAHLIENRQWLWIGATILVWIFARALIVFVLLPGLLFAVFSATLPIAVAVFLLAWPATRLARRNHVAFVASNLFRQLPAADQLAAISLLQDGNGRISVAAVKS
jgi:hypothetical protein